MTDSLRDKLSDVLDPVIEIDLSEAETSEYPYAVYDMETSPVMTKDGIARFDGDTRIRIVSNSFDEADLIRGQIVSAISAGMHDQVFSSRLLSTTKECVEGIWTIELNYTLRQYADWVNE